VASLGIDVGGSSIKWVVLNNAGDIHNSGVVPTPQTGKDDVLECLASLRNTPEESGEAITSAGVAVPASLDPREPVIRVLPNIPGNWEGLNLEKALRTRTGSIWSVLNDARAFGVSELSTLSKQGITDALFVTLGTGVGGAIALGGRIQLGGGGLAGEIGHVTVWPEGRRCGCGAQGCLEMYSGGLGILMSASELGWMPADDDDLGNPGAVFAAARNVDAVAQQAITWAGTHLGHVLGTLSAVLNPQAIVFGGGLAGSFDLMKPAFLGAMRSRLSFLPEPELFISSDTSFAGARGAAIWAQKQKEKETV
jgi:glucokinase